MNYQNNIFVKCLVVSIAFAWFTVGVVQANSISYDFDSGLQGWTNVNVASEGPSSFISTSGSLLGLSTLGISVKADNPHRDTAHNSGLLIRSEEFSFDALNDIEISFQLSGGGDGLAPATDTDAVLTSPSTSDGFVGLLLRNVQSGEYILVGSRDGSASSLQTIIWDTATLAGVVNVNDSYTLDLVDTDDGPWGWVALDNVSLTGVAIVPEPATTGLLVLGAVLAFRKRKNKIKC